MQSPSVLRRLVRQRAAMAAVAFLGMAVGFAVAGELGTPHDPYQQDLGSVLESPSGAHWLGTDELGRDVVSRLVISSRTSLLAAAYAVGIAVTVGVPPGLVAGYVGRWADFLVMRVTDAIMAFPALILAIAIVAVLGPNLRNAMVAVGVVFTPRFIRLTRGVVLGIREEAYIDASRCIGTPTTRIIRRHVLPNALSPLLVQVALTFGFAMLAEAGLSFVGLGAQSPDSSWGSMLGRSYRHVGRAPFLLIPPGVAIALTVLAFNLLGDGLRASIGRTRELPS